MTNLVKLADFWRQFSLGDFQARLDEHAAEVARRQDETAEEKKKVIEMLREFKSSQEDRTIVTAAAPLIKSFQRLTDLLETRSMAGEKAFFESYKGIAEVGDPVPALEVAAEKVSTLGSKLQDAEVEIKQLRETRGECEKEILDLKGKEKKLLELQNLVAKYDRNIDQALKERMEKVTEDLEKQAEERIRHIEEERLSAERKFAEAETKLALNQRQLEMAQSELFDTTQVMNEKLEAKAREEELLLNDLDKANEKLTMAEKQVEQLGEQVESVGGQKADFAEVMKAKELNSMLEENQKKLLSKEQEVERMVHQLDSLGNEITSLRADGAEALRKLQDANGQLSERVASFEEELRCKSDYETIKRELQVMKSVEFNAEENETPTKKSLEVLILEKNKTLQGENTKFRNEVDRLSKVAEEAQVHLAKQMRDNVKQSSLISELEMHIEELQRFSNVDRGEAEGRSSADVLQELNPAYRVKSGLSLDGGHDTEISISDENEESSIHHPSGNMLPIVQAQRERFRKRNEELEDEKAALLRQVDVLQEEIKGVTSDNVKLYEKIKFLQGYNAGGRSAPNPNLKDESGYQMQYERRLDPFTTFSYQERQRRYQQLNIPERVIFWMIRFAISNKIARLMVFIYAVLLHGLVFTVLIYTATNQSHLRDIGLEWQEKYAAHMRDDHPIASG